MAYTPTVWNNDAPPAIDADNLNKLETGVKAAHDALVSHELAVDPHTGYLTTAEGDARYPSQVSADARYLQLTGGALTGKLGAPALDSGSSSGVVYVGSTISGGAGGSSTRSTTIPTGTIPGDILIAFPVLYGNAAYPSDTAGFVRPVGFPADNSVVGTFGGISVGGEWFAKAATASDVPGGTVTFTWATSPSTRFVLITLRGAADPAVTPWEYYDGGTNLDSAAGVKSFTKGGAVLAAAVGYWENNSPAPTTSSIPQVMSANGVGSNPTVSLAFTNLSSAGPSPLVDWNWAGTVATGTGLLLVPTAPTGAPISVTSPVAMGGNAISNLKDPVAAQDASTKAYVDSHSGIPNGAVLGDTLRWTSSAAVIATSTYSAAGTNGLLAYCRTNTITTAPTQSSVFGGYGADLAIDGNLGNYMHTSNAITTPWWQVDFGATRAVSPTHVAVYGRSAASNFPQHYKIQGSNDGTTWTDQYATGGTANPLASTTWKTLVMTPVGGPYRYIRFQMTGQDTSSMDYLTFGEFEVYGQLWNVTGGGNAWAAERDAASDGKTYGRKNGAWAEVVATTTPAFVGPWSAATAYSAGQVVTHSGKTWGCLAAVAAGQPAPAPPGAITTLVPVGTDAIANAPVVAIATDGITASSVTYSNAAFTEEVGEPGGKLKTAWIKYTPASSGTVTFDGILSTGDAQLTLFRYDGGLTYSSFSELTQVAYDDDSAGGAKPTFAYAVVGGTTYYIRINAYAGYGMDYAITLSNARATAPVAGAWTQLAVIDPVPVPAGGTTDQVLAKSSATDYALKWATPAAGGGAATHISDNAPTSWNEGDFWTDAGVVLAGFESYVKSTTPQAFYRGSAAVDAMGGTAPTYTGVTSSAVSLVPSDVAGSSVIVDAEADFIGTPTLTSTEAGFSVMFAYKGTGTGSTRVLFRSTPKATFLRAETNITVALNTGVETDTGIPASTLYNNQPHLVILSWATSGAISLMMDGNVLWSGTNTPNASTSNIWRWADNTGYSGWVGGNFAEMAVWGRGLTGTEMSTIFAEWAAAPSGGIQPGPVMYQKIRGAPVMTGRQTILDEGTPVNTRAGLNFVGPSVTVSDDLANDRTAVTISTPNILVLGAADPVPGGTPAGTVIIRTA